MKCVNEMATHAEEYIAEQRAAVTSDEIHLEFCFGVSVCRMIASKHDLDNYYGDDDDDDDDDCTAICIVTFFLSQVALSDSQLMN